MKDCLHSWVITESGSTALNRSWSGTGASHVVAVTNGTVALRLALHLVGVQPGDEVLIPPLSFVATANAVAHLGAFPHFIDVDPLLWQWTLWLS